MEIHPPRLDATCMAICEYQPPLSCGLFLEVPNCDWALIFGFSPPAPGRWRGTVGTSNGQPMKHLNCVEGWVNGRTSPDFNRHNFGRWCFRNLRRVVSWSETKRWCEVTNGVNAGGQKRCARTPNISGAHVGLRGVATHTLSPGARVLIALDE